jgi:tetratricopeptide (TPR) repeat protein
MKSLLTKLFSALAITLFIVSCGGDPNIESAKLNLNRGDHAQVVVAADAAIATNPENPLGHYFRAIGLSEGAKKQPVAQREEGFRGANESFNTASELFAAQNRVTAESQYIDIHRIQVWADEYNNAVQLIIPESGEPTEQGMQRSIYHLKNAYAILPDSVQSLDVLSEVYYMTGDNQSAIQTMEKAIETAPLAETFRWLRLSYFYSTSGDREGALAVLNKAVMQFDDDIEVVQELANAYLAAGDRDNALLVVRQLIEANPNNSQYRLVYGTQVYQFVLDLGDDLRSAYDVISENNRMLRTEQRKSRPDAALVAQLRSTITEAEALVTSLTEQIERLTNEAEAELMAAAELNDSEPIIFNTLGIIYQNRAANLFDQRNATEDIREADRLDALAREMLVKSLPFYERAAEINPESTEYWMALFRIYTTLGMTEKALEAQDKAGL